MKKGRSERCRLLFPHALLVLYIYLNLNLKLVLRRLNITINIWAFFGFCFIPADCPKENYENVIGGHCFILFKTKLSVP